MKGNTLKKLLIMINILFSIHLIDINQIISNKNNLKTQNPKLSVVIPIYNGEKYINHSLKSVQNQEFKNLEIIIIDDHSNDKSLKIIKNYIQKDKRIKLIENKENRRILFCKSFGVLNSKGNYIIEIDQDDLFIRNDTFDILLNESEKFELDLLHFNHLCGNNINNIIKLHNPIKFKSIDKQPKLKYKQFNTTIYYLWGNLIKSDLYKKVIYNLWPIIINYKIIFQEDYLITFFILIYAQKSQETKNIFYYNFKNKRQASNQYQNNSEYYLCVALAGIIFYDYYIVSFPKDFLILINYINILRFDLKKTQKLYPTLFNYFFGKILSNNKLLKMYKNNLMKIFNISENCDSYPHLTRNQNYFILDKLSKNEKSFIERKNELIKLSIIIICSNYKIITKVIKQLNAQNFEFFEIIIIYDDENQQYYNLLNNYIKIFHHIKLINNEIKKGTFYSISVGIMKAKGDYLIILNQNCFFLCINALQNLYNEIKNDDADIFEFNLYKILPNNYIDLYKCNHFKSKFNFTHIKYNLEFNNIDIQKELLTNKIFKSKYIKNIIKKYKIEKYNEIIDYYYNDIFSFIIDDNYYKFKKVFSSNIYINDIDCDKIKFNDFKSPKTNMINETIFYISFIFDNSKKTSESKEKVLKEFFNVLSIIFNKFTKITKISLKLINKFIRSKYISKNNKALLKFYYNSLIH